MNLSVIFPLHFVALNTEIFSSEFILKEVYQEAAFAIYKTQLG